MFFNIFFISISISSNGTATSTMASADAVGEYVMGPNTFLTCFPLTHTYCCNSPKTSIGESCKYCPSIILRDSSKKFSRTKDLLLEAIKKHQNSKPTDDGNYGDAGDGSHLGITITWKIPYSFLPKDKDIVAIYHRAGKHSIAFQGTIGIWSVFIDGICIANLTNEEFIAKFK